MKFETVVVLDFGSQYNQLIVRRLRELGIYSELWSHDTAIEKLLHPKVKGIILSGGPQSVLEEARLEPHPQLWNLDIPILGICYGMQLMVALDGGTVASAAAGEYGAASIAIEDKTDPLFEGMTDSVVWMSHQDETTMISQHYKTLAHSAHCKYAAITHRNKRRWGIQFHPEVTHSEQGMKLLENFALTICAASQEWSMNHYIDVLKQEIKEEVGNEQVICGLSGGVDSAVTAALLLQCLPSQMHCIYIDHGLMRSGETEEVAQAFKPLLGDAFHQIDASERFFHALQGIKDPEEKRKCIGREFIAVFEEVASDIPNATRLAQGTLYTDIVESGKGGNSRTIKSHHNVGGLPDIMKLTLVEPLKHLFKDEVRKLGTVLGLPDFIVNRQPFPGPGLGIRVLGEVTREKVALVRESDRILREEIANHKLDKDIWQYFTALPGIRSVGVQGDARSYSDAIVIRAIYSVDGMSANIAQIPYAVLHHISRRITNEVPLVNRVLYDITDKPPGTIEFE